VNSNLLAGPPLIERWNGKAWRRVPGPAPVGGGFLSSVAATSSQNAWAVGFTASDTPLIERWNGTVWHRVPSPRPGRHRILNAVAATSATSAWAVGFIGTLGSGPRKTLIERWNGTAWRRVPSPTPADGGSLLGVAVGGARSVWTVGFTGSTGPGVRNQSLIEHWNGTAWRRVPITAPADSFLVDVAVISERNAWAVGVTHGGNGKPVIMHWNGNKWKVAVGCNICA